MSLHTSDTSSMCEYRTVQHALDRSMRRPWIWICVCSINTLQLPRLYSALLATLFCVVRNRSDHSRPLIAYIDTYRKYSTVHTVVQYSIVQCEAV
jgi:hypothetical protein